MEFKFYMDENKIKIMCGTCSVTFKSTEKKTPVIFQKLKDSIRILKTEEFELNPEYWDIVYGYEFDRPAGETTEMVYTDAMPILLINEVAV